MTASLHGLSGWLTVGETIKSRSVMETVVSVVGFALIMLISLVV